MVTGAKWRDGAIAEEYIWLLSRDPHGDGSDAMDPEQMCRTGHSFGRGRELAPRDSAIGLVARLLSGSPREQCPSAEQGRRGSRRSAIAGSPSKSRLLVLIVSEPDEYADLTRELGDRRSLAAYIVSFVMIRLCGATPWRRDRSLFTAAFRL
jgi:hypothetical protein